MAPAPAVVGAACCRTDGVIGESSLMPPPTRITSVWMRGLPSAGFVTRRRAFGFCWRYGVTRGLITARTSALQQAAPGAWAADF